MTDQEINLKCAKYLGVNYAFDNRLNLVYLQGGDPEEPDIFSPATDANDRDLVFDKLLENGWVISFTTIGGICSFQAYGPNKSQAYALGKTKGESEQVILEKIMNIINGSD